MTETLGQKQRHFTRLVGLLIEYAYQEGYELTFGDAYRDPPSAWCGWREEVLQLGRVAA